MREQFFLDMQELVLKTWTYERIGFDKREMTFDATGAIGQGRERCEISWHMSLVDDVTTLHIHGLFGLTCSVVKMVGRVWKGRWLVHEKMPVEITPS
jgi:hypothetical protein